jgi:hypothetical protein
MNLGHINLITPPDRLYNSNISYLLVKPSTKVKMQFQNLLSQMPEDVNVYVFDDDEMDIDWLLSVSQTTDIVIIDIDNCDAQTRLFVSLLLTQASTYYMTSDEITPWHLISKKRIYNLDWINDILDNSEDDSEEHDD